MNYQKIYNNLIEKASCQNRKRLRKNNKDYIYYENHHIIPECFFINRKRKGPKGWIEGNPNARENLVLLTSREHYLAHQILVKMHPTNKSCIYALHMMTVNNKTQIRNNKEYEWIRRLCKETKMSDERKRHLSRINTGKKLSDDTKKKISASNKGRAVSDETKHKIGCKNSKIIKDKIIKGTHIVWNLEIPMSDVTKEKLSDSLKTTYKNGRELSSSCFSKGAVPHNVIGKIYYFQSPEDIIYKTDNITKFSKYMKLSPSAVACLNKGTYTSVSHKGWSVPNKITDVSNITEYLFNKDIS